MEAFPSVRVWRRSVKDKKASTSPDKVWWDTVLGLVRVHQGPHKDLELVYVKIRRHFIDAVFNENVTLRSIVPYDRFPFSTAPS